MFGERAERRGQWGKAWWGKRPMAGQDVSWRAGTNKFFKRQLHKKERLLDKKEIENDLSKD